VAICGPAALPQPASGGRVTVYLRETFATHDASFTRTVPFEPLAGAELSSTIDDVSLDKLGIARTLHLTIGLKPGTVRLEHALLIPGAIALK